MFNTLIIQSTLMHHHQHAQFLFIYFYFLLGKELSKSIPINTDIHPVIIKLPPHFGRPKRPSFDLSDAIEALQSPVCSSGSSAHSRLSRSSRSSFLLDDYIQENMQAALKNSSNPLGSNDNGMHIAFTSTKDKHPEVMFCVFKVLLFSITFWDD